MIEGKTIAVVVPCFNEELLIERVITTMPNFVDRIIVVDDKSSDKTSIIVKQLVEKNEKLSLIEHSFNQGVGGAIATGYKQALSEEIDVTAVMAGDAQMDPDDLEAIALPVVRGECDFSKGNRLFTGDAWNVIPKVRYLGNSLLSLLTKIASGYWHIADSQSGYTAANLNVLKTIHWDRMYKRYGQPNDLLVRLNIYSFRVRDIMIKPVYGVGEKSGIKPIRMIPRLSWLICKLFFFRMIQKYVIRDFHPLLFFYLAGLVLSLLGGGLGSYLVFVKVKGALVAETSVLLASFLMITGLQFLLFGMWFDMESNRHLK